MVICIFVYRYYAPYSSFSKKNSFLLTKKVLLIKKDDHKVIINGLTVCFYSQIERYVRQLFTKEINFYEINYYFYEINVFRYYCT